jgi:hypothetical protein
MSEYRVTIRHDDGSERRVTVLARDRAEAIGRASALAETPGRPVRGRVTVQEAATAA